jgi:hypothetical protein
MFILMARFVSEDATLRYVLLAVAVVQFASVLWPNQSRKIRNGAKYPAKNRWCLKN